jgi:hypothetical protein
MAQDTPGDPFLELMQSGEEEEEFFLQIAMYLVQCEWFSWRQVSKPFKIRRPLQTPS